MDLKRIIGLLMVCALLLTALAPSQTACAAGESTKRVIDVVYDDSGSMYGDGVTPVDRWSQALYAMEVFCTMLGSEDEMNVYLMSNKGASPVQVKGSDTDRVDRIVNALGETGNTPFETVTAAGSHITSVSADAERWLVVLTDGAFNSTSTDRVDSAFSGYAQQGIHVVYLAIGAAAVQLDGDSSIDYYTYHASDSSQILPCITEIANQIFQQQILPASHITTSGNTMTLDIDIPVSQLLVFAQGEGISVEGLASDQTLTATGSHRVEVTEANIPASWVGQTILADGLCGVVQTYTADGDPFSKGTYTLTVSDTSNVEIYYIAGTTIDCHLTYNGVEVKDDEKHYAGEYGISMRFLDPLTGEEVTSDLLDDAVFTAELSNNGTVQTIDSSVTSVQLQEGDVALEATAELPGHVTVHSSHSYTVYPQPIQLALSAQMPGDGYKLSALGEQAEAILITATNAATGEKLSQEEWDAIGDDLTVNCPANINWLVRQGDEVSTWEIRPDYITDMSDTDSGTMDLTIKAEYELGNQYASGATQLQVNVASYVASELKIEIVPPEEAIPLNDLKNAEGALVRVYTKDEYTGDYQLLTAEQSENVALSVTADDLNWTLTPGDETGTWILLPLDDTAALSFSGDRTVVAITGTLADGDYYYQGANSQELSILCLTLLEKLLRALPYLIGGAVILFLLIGYLCKKKLRLKQFDPVVVNMAVRPRKTLNVRTQKIWWSYLLPYFAQRAKISSHQNSFNCRFPDVVIKAAGNNSFYLVNLRAFAGANTRIDGEQVDAKEMRHSKFYVSTIIGSYSHGKVAGEFRFC
jgi:hypothetical protein